MDISLQMYESKNSGNLWIDCTYTRNCIWSRIAPRQSNTLPSGPSKYPSRRFLYTATQQVMLLLTGSMALWLPECPSNSQILWSIYIPDLPPARVQQCICPKAHPVFAWQKSDHTQKYGHKSGNHTVIPKETPVFLLSRGQGQHERVEWRMTGVRMKKTDNPWWWG